MRTDFWSVDIPAPPEQVFPYLWQTALVAEWVAAHDRAAYRFPAEPRYERTAVTSFKVRVGWRVSAECNKVDLNHEVAHRFVQGPIKGTERWVIEQGEGGGTRMSKILTYEIIGRLNRAVWLLVGRAAHSRISKRQLRTLRKLVAG